MSDAADETTKPSAPPMSRGRRALIALVVVIVAAAIVVAGVLYWLHARHYESTDDASVDGHVSQVSAQIAGRVVAVAIEDNQAVAAGQLLVALDGRDARIRLDQAVVQQAQAQAQLDRARAEVELQAANIDGASAQVRVSEAELTQARQDFARFRGIDPNAITRQQLDAANAAARTAQARLEANRTALVGARAELAAERAAVAGAEAALRGNEVTVRDAELNLSYTRVVAPAAGRITRRTVEPGNYVVPGQALLSVVQPGMWVTANFKETQLAHMRANQPVDVRIDAIPDHVFHGHVDSFQTGSGSAFSTLPAENATGNYVKVVQRVPVKIVLDEASDPRLAPGLSATPRVTVR